MRCDQASVHSRTDATYLTDRSRATEICSMSSSKWDLPQKVIRLFCRCLDLHVFTAIQSGIFAMTTDSRSRGLMRGIRRGIVVRGWRASGLVMINYALHNRPVCALLLVPETI